MNNSVYDLIKKYGEYVVNYIGMLTQGNFAPIGACEFPGGEIRGLLYTARDMSFSLSVEEVLKKMEKEFEQRLKENRILSYVILYHSRFNNDDDHRPSESQDDLRAISIKYKGEISGYIPLAYTIGDEEVSFQGFPGFSQEENNSILSTVLKENKEYFQEKIALLPEETVTPGGLKLKKVNLGDLGNTWGGVWGFDRFRTPEGSESLGAHFALLLQSPGRKINDTLTIHEKEYESVVFKALSLGGKGRTIIPVIKNETPVDVENHQIDEWTQMDSLEAVITGRGRGSFAVTYLATDYAENREKYLSRKKGKIRFSGILYVLDNKKLKDEENKFGKGFAAFMPNKNLGHQGCFDFVGTLEDFKEVTLLESLKGYLLMVTLINNPENPAFFTIPLFVNPENMNFEDLEKGMSLSGLFQLQGALAD